MKKSFELFLFDLDDTLLDFKESENLSFALCLQSLGIKTNLPELYRQYQIINAKLWKQFEECKTTKDHLKVQRFRELFEANKLSFDPEIASSRYLDALPETVVLIDHAKEICEWLSTKGEIGIITNGIQSVQMKRIQNSAIAPYISFVSVSEECGHAKPDSRFFDYTVKKARKFSKDSTIIVGDRIEADIIGAKNFGITGCWFNPRGNQSDVLADIEIRHLAELRTHLD